MHTCESRLRDFPYLLGGGIKEGTGRRDRGGETERVDDGEEHLPEEVQQRLVTPLASNRVSREKPGHIL